MGNEELRSELMQSSHSERTKELYGWYLVRFKAWCEKHGVDELDDELVSRFLTEQYAVGYAPATVDGFRCAISFDALQNDLPSPVGGRSIRVVQGVKRVGKDRNRGQSEGLTYDQYRRIMATACDPRPFRGVRESFKTAEKRGQMDRVIVSLLFMGGMRRSEVRNLRWQHIDFSNDQLIYIKIPQSKTNQDGNVEDIRVLKKEGADAIRKQRAIRLNEPTTARVVPLTGESINRRFQVCCESIGLKGRYTSHSGRIGLASELCARGAPIQAVALAGGWQSADTVIHYSKKTERERGAVAMYL